MGARVRIETVLPGHRCAVPPIPRPHGSSPNLLEAVGRQVAAALIAGIPGDTGTETGWRGGLQTAADLTADDQDVLQIADDIHLAAHDLATRAGVRAYALSTTPTVAADGPGRWLLAGMLNHLDNTDHPGTGENARDADR